MAKVGRNDPCPCGSGKKYKKCHGSIEHLDRISKVMAQAPLMHARAQAAQTQRERQQGVGRPIISTDFKGYRLVAVRNRVHYSQKWKTFHDFLLDYIKIVMGEKWWMSEVRKPADQRHTILQWAELTAENTRKYFTEQGKVNSGPMTGATAAYLNLAYDLYALDHAVELQDRLISRLQNAENFAGARYEVNVAAKLLRAGFDLTLEDETDGSTTHVEFTATNKKSGKQFSVEAKQRDANKIRINRLLYRALKKNAPHARMVFLDINEPDAATDVFPPKFLLHAEARLRAYEHDPVAAQLPPAYVIVTNTPWHFNLSGEEHRCSALVHGFHIPEVQTGHPFRSIREAVDARDAHIELHDLMMSIQEHSSIPSTFDGEIPEFAFEPSDARLVVGQRYSMPDATGAEFVGVLESALVMEHTSSAFCVLKLDDDQRITCTLPLSATEMQAWRRHPDTFFGVVDRNANRKVAKNPVDWYDFFYESYRHTSREKLLEFMADAPDHEHLLTLDQVELARIYCERLAAHVLHEAARHP